MILIIGLSCQPIFNHLENSEPAKKQYNRVDKGGLSWRKIRLKLYKKFKIHVNCYSLVLWKSIEAKPIGTNWLAIKENIFVTIFIENKKSHKSLQCQNINIYSMPKQKTTFILKYTTFMAIVIHPDCFFRAHLSLLFKLI